jgi:hypothetical protein
MIAAVIGTVIAYPAIAVDFSSVTVDPNELQQFEASYENWVQNVVQNVLPNPKATVLVEFNYSQDADRLQTYSELRSTSHLPGLPNVFDPNPTHPAESAIFALVESKKIKLIYDQALSAGQEKLLSEIVSAKLRLKTSSGDKLTVNTIETSAPQNTTNNKPWWIAVALIAAAIVVTATRKPFKSLAAPTTVAAQEPTQNRTVQPPPPPVKPFTFGENDRQIMNRMQNVESVLVEKTNSIINPTHVIVKANPKALIRVVRKESSLILAQAMQGSSIIFQKTLLSICTPSQRNEIREIGPRLKSSKTEARFAQNLIAAKIHREVQTFPNSLDAIKPTRSLEDSVEQFSENSTARAATRSQMKLSESEIINRLQSTNQQPPAVALRKESTNEIL